MAVWLPIIKTVLPYLAPVLHVALPAFTKRKTDQTDPVVDQQIGELQDAVKANSESTKALAKAIEEAAQANDRAMKRLWSVTVLAVAMAFLALMLAIAGLVI